MISVGIIGYGYWGPNLARSFAEADASKVLVISDLDAGALARAAKRHPSARTTQDAREVIHDPEIDAVVIATPVRTHYDLALAALRAGKHVLLEKPMTETAGQARELIAEANKRSLTLMVDHTFIYTSAVMKIRELVMAGELGDIYYYDSIRVNLGLFQHDVNVIWDLAVHDLSILEHVIAEHPTVVSANGMGHVPGSPENMAYLTLYFESGTMAHVNVNWLAPVKVRQTLIGGSRKMIVYDDMEASEKVKVYDRGVTTSGDPEQLYQLLIDYRIGDMWAPRLPAKEALRTEVEHFIDCIAHGRTPITDGTMGLRVVELLEAATWSMRQRGQPIDLRLVRKAS